MNRNALPPQFRDIEIIGPAELDIPKIRELHKRVLRAAVTTSELYPVITMGPPLLQMSKETADAYRSDDFAKIKALQDAAQKDLSAIYANAASMGEKAWTKVRSTDGKEFYMSWSETGSIWSYTLSQEQISGTSANYVQIGTYSATASIMGTTVYNITTPELLSESVVALMAAKAMGKVIGDGLVDSMETKFVEYLNTAAQEIDLNVIFKGIGDLTSSLVFVVVFIGLKALWGWLNRSYTIQVQVFNWDSNQKWSSSLQATRNGVVAGDNLGTGKSTYGFILPAMGEAQQAAHSVPGGMYVESLDHVCYYATVVWENDKTLMNGCTLATSVTRGNSADIGFSWAFDCPRFSDNKQTAINQVIDPDKYIQHPSWRTGSDALHFDISVEPSEGRSVPVTFALDALSGAEDNLYRVNIHINKAMDQVDL